ncbi:MAG: tetratricopeptide repeat protein [candidate division Zixibacteria bacterium]|nr:tetratricopeptide repeat protein [candidate division Zixibacteria bacterium]
MKKESLQKNSDDKSILRFNLFIAFFCAALILAHFISSFFPGARLWGINHLAYFPLWVKILFTLIGLLVLLPWINQKINLLLRKFLDFLHKSFSGRRYLWYFVFSLASIIIFYLFRDQTHFLGDGAQIISLLEKGKLYIKWTEPLEILLHLYAYQFLNGFFKINAVTLYYLISFIGGAIFIFLLFLLAELLGRDREEGLLMFMILGTTGSLQLFFGYVEHYTMLYVFLVSYLYFSIRFVKRKSSFIPVVIFFFLSIFSHFSAFYLFPSLAFLLWIGFEFKNKKNKRYYRWGFLSASMVFLCGFLYYYIKNMWMLGQIFVPLNPGNYYAPDYTHFSSSHLLDVISLQLLLSPTGLFLLLVFLVGWSKKSKEIFSANKNLFFFLIIVSLFQVGYNFLINPGLGMARDWDLFSSTSLGYTILGIFFLLKSVKIRKDLRYIFVVLILTSFLFTFPWILINHNPQMSIQRFENLLDLDIKKSRNGRFILGQYFSKLGMREEEERVTQAFQEKLPEVSLTDLALSYYREGEVEKSIQLLQKAIQIEPGFAESHNFLGLAYYNKDRISEAEAEYSRAIELRPGFQDSYINLGHLYAKKKDYKKAIKNYEKAVRLKAENFEVYYNLGVLYLKENKLSKAKPFIEKALTLQPDSHVLHFSLGDILFKSGKLNKAEKAFLKSIQLKEDYHIAHYYLSLLYSKIGEKLKAEKEYELFLKYKPEDQILPLIPSVTSDSIPDRF